MILKDLHSNSDLATCEIFGVFVFPNKIVFLTCGTARIVVRIGDTAKIIHLNKRGNRLLFDLTLDIRSKVPNKYKTVVPKATS